MKGRLARVLWRITGGKACHCPVLTHGVSAVIGLSDVQSLIHFGGPWACVGGEDEECCVKMRSVALVKPLGVKMLKNDC